MPHAEFVYVCLELVGFSALLTIFSIPILRNISDLLSRIGIYHDGEPWYIRASLLYKCYLYAQIPIVFSIFSIFLTINTIYNVNQFNAMLIALGSCAFLPVSLRILSLAKNPLPIEIESTNWNALKSKYESELTKDLIKFWDDGEFKRRYESLLGDENSSKFESIWSGDLANKFGRIYAERYCESTKKSILREKKERWISSVVSMIFIGWLTYIVLALTLLIDQRIIFIPPLEIPGSDVLALLSAFLLLPVGYVVLGEVYIKLCGGVNNDLKIPLLE